MLTVSVWRPGEASMEHGVVQAVSGRLSSIALAPAGLVMMLTACAVPDCGARFGGSSGVAGFFASSLGGSFRSAGGMGLGFGSPPSGVAPGGVEAGAGAW